MRLLTILVALPLACVAGSRDHRRDDNVAIVNKKYIIEVAPDGLKAVSALFEAKDGAKILRSFNSTVFSGLTVESDVDNIDSLLAIEQVIQAWPLRRYKIATPLLGSDMISKRDIAAKNYSIHHLTGVDKLHAAGITGKGVTVAVVDSGLDYYHPALGGCYGLDCRIIGGHDFGGDLLYPDVRPDEDPMDSYGHGTHVAGIVAGSDGWFQGVAPDATMLAYKITDSSDSTYDDWIMQAFIRANEDGADIITCSWGGDSGWGEGPLQTVASRLVELGVIITMSAGNKGETAGVFWANEGANADGVLSVASTIPSTVAARPFTATFSLDGAENITTLGFDPARYTAPNTNFDYNWNIKDRDIVLLGFDSPANEACSSLPADTPSLAGKIPLIRVEGCSVKDKQGYLDLVGADHVLFYSLAGGFEKVSTNSTRPKVGVVETKTALAIIATIKAGGKVVASFDREAPNYVQAELTSGGIASPFTTWGGLYDLKIKPDIAGPGSNILSAKWSRFDSHPTQYMTQSGTSMSCPYIAGVAALYVSKYGGRGIHGPGFAKKVAAQIIASGNAVPWKFTKPADSGQPTTYDYFAPVAQVGSGNVDAWKLLTYSTTLGFEKMVLNDTSNFQRYHKIAVTNNHDAPVTYSFSLQPAGGFEAQGPRPHDLAVASELSPVSIVPDVTLPSRGLSLQPGETKTFNVNFKPISYANESRLPIYSGKVIVSSSVGEVLSVPYMGAAFDLKQQMRHIFPEGKEGPYQSDKSGQPRDINIYNRYSFDLETHDFPMIVTSVKWGSRQVRWDIFDDNWVERQWSWPLVPGEKGYVGSATYHLSPYGSGVAGWPYDNSSEIDINAVAPFPAQIHRTSSKYFSKYTFAWIGKMADGSIIAPGNYTIRFAALQPFGVYDRADDWDVWKTPVITVI